jgi:hypothetical protein
MFQRGRRSCNSRTACARGLKPLTRPRARSRQAFRELAVQCQLLRKKEGSKDFGPELKAMEARLKRLQLQARRPSHIYSYVYS